MKTALLFLVAMVASVLAIDCSTYDSDTTGDTCNADLACVWVGSPPAGDCEALFVGCYQYPVNDAGAACGGCLAGGGKSNCPRGGPAGGCVWFDGGLYSDMAGCNDATTSLGKLDGHLYKYPPTSPTASLATTVTTDDSITFGFHLPQTVPARTAFSVLFSSQDGVTTYGSAIAGWTDLVSNEDFSATVKIADLISNDHPIYSPTASGTPPVWTVTWYYTITWTEAAELYKRRNTVPRTMNNVQSFMLTLPSTWTDTLGENITTTFSSLKWAVTSNMITGVTTVLGTTYAQLTLDIVTLVDTGFYVNPSFSIGTPAGKIHSVTPATLFCTHGCAAGSPPTYENQQTWEFIVLVAITDICSLASGTTDTFTLDYSIYYTADASHEAGPEITVSLDGMSDMCTITVPLVSDWSATTVGILAGAYAAAPWTDATSFVIGDTVYVQFDLASPSGIVPSGYSITSVTATPVVAGTLLNYIDTPVDLKIGAWNYGESTATPCDTKSKVCFKFVLDITEVSTGQFNFITVLDVNVGAKKRTISQQTITKTLYIAPPTSKRAPETTLAPVPVLLSASANYPVLALVALCSFLGGIVVYYFAK